MTLVRHGYSGTRLHTIWKGMRQRCLNPGASGYKNYGGKGIAVCQEWEEFSPFKEWAEVNGYADQLQIDRIDASGNYCPGNCRWVTKRENTVLRNKHYSGNKSFSRSKVTPEQAENIRELRISGLTYREIGEMYGYSISQVSRIVKKQLITINYKEVG